MGCGTGRITGNSPGCLRIFVWLLRIGSVFVFVSALSSTFLPSFSVRSGNDVRSAAHLDTALNFTFAGIMRVIRLPDVLLGGLYEMHG